MYVYIYIYIYTHTHVYIYIYIYIYRERERSILLNEAKSGHELIMRTPPERDAYIGVTQGLTHFCVEAHWVLLWIGSPLFRISLRGTVSNTVSSHHFNVFHLLGESQPISVLVIGSPPRPRQEFLKGLETTTVVQRDFPRV